MSGLIVANASQGGEGEGDEGGANRGVDREGEDPSRTRRPGSGW